jgi:peroxiredoxin
MGAAVIAAMAVAWVFALALVFLLYGMTRQQGELLARVASLESSLRELLQRPVAAAAPVPAPPPPAPQPQLTLLEPGAKAPEFRLVDLRGRERRLRDFLGKPLVLVFFDPQCGFCQQLAPRLAEIGGDARVVVVTRRAPEETQRLAEQYGWSCDIVVEPDWAVATAYGTNGTPTGYLIDRQGRIASPLAVGADALLALAA